MQKWFFLLLLTQPVFADEIPQTLPPVPDGGLIVLYRGDCTDEVSQEQGQCTSEDDVQGNHYLVFKQNGEIQFIRQVTGDGYKTLYMNPRFNSF